MLGTVTAIIVQIAKGDDPRWVGWASLALAASAVLLAASHTFPSAVRLGRRIDAVDRQSRLARSICRDHLFCLAAMGFSGLNSFVGEFLIVSGGFTAGTWLGVMGVWGVGLGTTYILWLYYRVVLGEVNPGLRGHTLDINLREMATLVPLVVLALVIGLYPESFLGFFRVSVTSLLRSVPGSSLAMGGL